LKLAQTPLDQAAEQYDNVKQIEANAAQADEDEEPSVLDELSGGDPVAGLQRLSEQRQQEDEEYAPIDLSQVSAPADGYRYAIDLPEPPETDDSDQATDGEEDADDEEVA